MTETVKKTTTRKPKTEAAAAPKKAAAKTNGKTNGKLETKTNGKLDNLTVMPSPVLPSHDQIAALAHRYWAERGYQHGNDASDWLRAEQELRGMAS
jgi:hypothetical protein